jgi:predicted  nucleic acid-binding Zn-ribbon protein
MSPDLQRLTQLQQLDSTINDARHRIASYPQRLADVEARLSAAAHAVEQARQHLKDNQEARRTLEKDAALYQGRLAKFKDQLAAVKTNREYTAMQHEIAAAEGELGSAEEKVLERMVEADALTAEVKQHEMAMAARQKEIDAEKKELAEEIAGLEASLAKASETRATVVKDMEPRLIALFEQVAKVRKGIALCTATRDGLCSVCHVRLRPQVFQMVRQNDQIIQCDSCQRILYYIPPPPPVEHPIVRR